MTIKTFGLNTTNDVQSWADSGLGQSTPNSAQGANDRYYVSNVSGTQACAVLQVPGLKAFFDTVGTVTINSVTLRLRRLNNATAPSRNVQLRRLLTGFTEAQVTWNNRASGTPWQTAGAKGASDSDPAILATGLMPSTGGSYFSVSGAALNTWLANVLNGSITDYGWILELENPATIGGGDFDIASKERSTDGQRPFLEVDYTATSFPNVSIDNVTVTNLAGQAILRVSLSGDAPAGGLSGVINTTQQTAKTGVDFSGLQGIPFSIPQGDDYGDIIVPILPNIS